MMGFRSGIRDGQCLLVRLNLSLDFLLTGAITRNTYNRGFLTCSPGTGSTCHEPTLATTSTRSSRRSVLRRDRS